MQYLLSRKAMNRDMEGKMLNAIKVFRFVKKHKVTYRRRRQFILKNVMTKLANDGCMYWIYTKKSKGNNSFPDEIVKA